MIILVPLLGTDRGNRCVQMADMSTDRNGKLQHGRRQTFRQRILR